MKGRKEAEVILKQYILQTRASNNTGCNSGVTSGKYKESLEDLQKTFKLQII